jgi:hypothetical protein
VADDVTDLPLVLHYSSLPVDLSYNYIAGERRKPAVIMSSSSAPQTVKKEPTKEDKPPK